MFEPDTAELKALVKRVTRICEDHSRTRIDAFGGYPDDWTIRLFDDQLWVIRATIEGEREPSLEILTVDQFLADYEDDLEEEATQ